VVLVHGLGATNASMLPLIAALSRDFHVLAPDLPGHGGTQAKGIAHGAEFLGNAVADLGDRQRGIRDGDGPATA